MGDLAYTFIRTKSTNMLPMYLQNNDAPQILRHYEETWIFVVFKWKRSPGKLYSGFISFGER